VALSGTFGYELDITKMDPAERAAIPGQVANYHRFHRLIAEGDYYRLASWNDLQPYDAWIVVSKDRKEALLTAVQVLGRPNAKSRILTLAGLDPSAAYTVEDVMEGKETGKEYGDSLMQCGMLIPNMGDFKSRLWYFSV
jgi:alpha-galactosidase